jgi:hypothetical protein
MVSNILIAVGLIGVVIPLSDIFLSESQKDVVSMRFHSLWNWLSDKTKLGLLAHITTVINQFTFRRLLLTIALCIGVLVPEAIFLLGFSILETAFIILFFSMGIASYANAFYSKSLFGFLTRSIALTLVCAIPGTYLLMLTDNQPLSWALIIIVFFSCWIVAIPFLLFYGVMGILAGSELLLRRILEYPKGGVVAASSVITAVGVVLNIKWVG